MSLEELRAAAEATDPCEQGRWYGGPGMWHGCLRQECGYCGSRLAIVPAEDHFEAGPETIAIPTDVVLALIEIAEAGDALSKALKAWVLSGLDPDDWPSVRDFGVAYERSRAALDRLERP